MDRRGCFGVLAGFLLISVAVGVHDAVAVGRLRVLMAGKEAERSKSGQEAGSQSAPAPPLEGSGSKPSSVPNSSPPPGNPPNSPPPSRAPPNPTAASHKAAPLTPVSGSLSKPAPTSGSLSVPVSGSPSHPPPAPSGPMNPPSSSGKPSNPPPPPQPPGSPSHTSPASDGSSSAPPASGNHPVPPKSKVPNPVPNGRGKEKEEKKQTASSSDPHSSQGKGQENDKCNASTPISCHVGGLVACLQKHKNESQKWSLLVQNEGESPLSVHIVAPSSVKIDESLRTLPLAQHKISKIELHVDAAEGQRIVLNAGNGDCTLTLTRPSSFVENLFQQFPNYANHLTPIYGVYLASLTVIFAGGMWACCKFRKRRWRVDAGAPYQQLEMGALQQSGALVDENVMDGWDAGWNDDWDEEAAAPRPPAARGSASENGVISRSSDKNEWEDWDD